MADDTRVEPEGDWFSISFPGDQRFLETAADLASKAAEVGGCSQADAAAVGRAVGAVVARSAASVLRGCGGPVLGLRFATTGQRFEIEMLCTPAGPDVTPDQAFGLDPGVPGFHMEVGRRGASIFCRLSYPLPQAGPV